MSRYFTKQLFFLVLLCTGLAVAGSAQSRKSLENKKKKLQEEIRYTNKLLKETEKSKTASLNQLRQLNRKISSRENLISTIQEEINLLNDSIGGQTLHIDSLESNLVLLKEEYARMIQNAYRNRSSYNKLMFLFSSDNFNQAYKRLKYFQQYAQYRQAQAARIVEEQEKIAKQISILEAIRQSNEGLLKAQLSEKNELASEKTKKVKVVNSLKGKEQELKKALKKKEKARQQAAKAIERIIAEEIRKAKEAAAKAGKNSDGFPLTPEAKALSNSFAANKGKLPWPVSEGIITGKYGKHPHPTLRGIEIDNDGIDISTKKENTGRAVFEGEVSSVVIIPGEGKLVMIKHGKYFTLYSYFKEVFVTAGDKVSIKQNLGVLIEDDKGANSIMHFQIWNWKTKLNPSQWIFKN